MANNWQKISKPSSQSWVKVVNAPFRQPNGEFGFAEFGLSNFGQGPNIQPSNWKKISKPSSQSWVKKAKPTQ